MNEGKEKYEKLLDEAKNNPNIVGLILCGARGKTEELLTEHSDYDVVVVITNDSPEDLKNKIQSFEAKDLEVWAKTMSEFREHARWGTEHDWDRYNYAHLKAVLDKTGEVQKIIDEKGNLPKDAQRKYVEFNLDSYLNSVYRSAKYWRDGNDLSALMDASESLPYLMTILYALEGRVNPYNKYFEWELRNYPLALLPWGIDEFITDYKSILTTGDIKVQEKIFQGVKKLVLDHGYGESIKDWNGKYFVG